MGDSHAGEEAHVMRNSFGGCCGQQGKVCSLLGELLRIKGDFNWKFRTTNLTFGQVSMVAPACNLSMQKEEELKFEASLSYIVICRLA